MKPITVKQLFKECANQIEKGNADKVIMISQDDEGNGYHYLWYSFSTPDEVLIEGYNDYVIDGEVAKKEDTIILG